MWQRFFSKKNKESKEKNGDNNQSECRAGLATHYWKKSTSDILIDLRRSPNTAAKKNYSHLLCVLLFVYFIFVIERWGEAAKELYVISCVSRLFRRTPLPPSCFDHFSSQRGVFCSFVKKVYVCLWEFWVRTLREVVYLFVHCQLVFHSPAPLLFFFIVWHSWQRVDDQLMDQLIDWIKKIEK